METPTYNQGIWDVEAGELPGVEGLAMLPNEDQASLNVLWGLADGAKQGRRRNSPTTSTHCFSTMCNSLVALPCIAAAMCRIGEDRI